MAGPAGENDAPLAVVSNGRCQDYGRRGLALTVVMQSETQERIARQEGVRHADR